MKTDILKPTKMLEESIDATKMRVKVSILKVAKVVEDERVFKSVRAGWQIAFYLKNKTDALKVIGVAVANDFESGGPTKQFGINIYEVYVNLNEKYS